MTFAFIYSIKNFHHISLLCLRISQKVLETEKRRCLYIWKKKKKNIPKSDLNLKGPKVVYLSFFKVVARRQ